MKKTYWILIIFSAGVMLAGFTSIGINIFIKYVGTQVNAVVIDVPNECDRYNHINVLLNDTEYEVSISRDNCINTRYKKGQEVKLLKHPYFEQLIWPGSDPEIVLLLIVTILLYVTIVQARLFRNKSTIKKSND